MKFLSKSNSIFSLNESNKYIGSLISKQDAEKIFEVDDLSYLYKKKEYMDEGVLQKHWYKKEIINCPHQHRSGNIVISFDELVLSKIMKIAYPTLEIEQQVNFDGRKYVDFVLTLGTDKKVVEFMGPHHFINHHNASNFQNPLDRKKLIEDCFGFECVIWPYWIQRCRGNVKTIFEKEKYQGSAALWSSKAMFCDFSFPESGQMIVDISKRFNALLSGIGYMYDELDSEYRKKSEHPSINQVLNNHKLVEMYFPWGAGIERPWFWVPHKICKNYEIMDWLNKL